METTMLTKTQFTSRYGQTINLEQTKKDRPETALYNELVSIVPTIDINKDSAIDFDEYIKSRIDLTERNTHVDAVEVKGVLNNRIEDANIAIELSVDQNASSQSVVVLAMAVNMRKQDIFELLIKHGADINATDQREEHKLLTPMMLDCTKALLDHNADTEVIAIRGITALMFTVKKGGNVEILKLLLDKGADVKVTDNNGNDVLYYVNTIPNMEQKDKMLAVLKEGVGALGKFVSSKYNGSDDIKSMILNCKTGSFVIWRNGNDVYIYQKDSVLHGSVNKIAINSEKKDECPVENEILRTMDSATGVSVRICKHDYPEIKVKKLLKEYYKKIKETYGID